MFPIWKIAGLAEEPTGTWNRFARLFGERHLIDPTPDDTPNPGDPATWPDRDWNGSQTAYWFGKLTNVHDPEWPGFYARRELEFWAQATEGTSS